RSAAGPGGPSPHPQGAGRPVPDGRGSVRGTLRVSTTGTTHTLVVEAGKAGQRVDLFIGESLGLSRAKLKRLFDSGAVKGNGGAAKKGLLVAAGQSITVVVPEERREVVPEPEAPLTVLHEDAVLVFVDKPAGRPSHPLQPGETGTVANALVARYPECAEASE